MSLWYLAAVGRCTTRREGSGHFGSHAVPGMTAKEIKKYIRYIADWRLGQLGFQPIYMVDEHPLPWLAPLLNGVEHANFFETRATEYAKAATGGAWHGTEGAWGLFDRRVTRRGQMELLGGSDARP